MTQQILRDRSGNNLFPIRAARFFIDKDGELDPDKKGQLFEEYWPIKRIARLLLDEAEFREEWLIEDFQVANISLENLYILDPKAIDVVFTKLYPLLEPHLLRSLRDPFYDNQLEVNQETREERAETLDRLHSALNAPAELIGETGTRTGQAPIFVKRAYQRADAMMGIVEAEIVVDRTVDKIVNQSSNIVSPTLSRELARKIIENPEIVTIVGKISNLPDNERTMALASFGKTLSNSLSETTKTFLDSIEINSPPAPLMVTIAQSVSVPPVIEPIVTSQVLAGEVVNTLFELVSQNDKPVLINEVEKVLDSPVLDSPITHHLFSSEQSSPQPFRELFTKVAIETVISEAAKQTGQEFTLAPEAYQNLFTKVNQGFDNERDYSGPSIAGTILDSLPTIEKKPLVLIASQKALQEITFTQAITVSSNVTGNLFNQAVLDTNFLQLIGGQISETADKLQIQTIKQPTPLTVTISRPTVQQPISSQVLAGQAVDHLFSQVTDRPVLVNQIVEILDSPVIGATDSPLFKDTDTLRAAASTIIQTVIDQTSTTTGEKVAISPSTVSTLVTQLADQLTNLKSNTSEALVQTVVNALPPTVTSGQRESVATKAAQVLDNITFTQILTTPPTPQNITENPPTPVILTSETLKSIGGEILGRTSQTPPSLVVNPIPLTISITPIPTSIPLAPQTDNLAQQIASRVFPSANGTTPVLIEEIKKILDKPVIESGSSPLGQNTAIKDSIIKTAIQVVTNQASIATGEKVDIKPDKIIDLVAHISNLLIVPNQNTAKTISQVISDALPGTVTPQQKQSIIAESTINLKHLTLGQVFTTPTTPIQTERPLNPIVLDTETLNLIGDNVKRNITEEIGNLSQNEKIVPGLALQLANDIPGLNVEGASKEKIISRVASTISGSPIDRKTAEKIVQNFGQLIPSSLDHQNYLDSLQTSRDTAILAIASSGTILNPSQVKEIADILVPPTPQNPKDPKIPAWALTIFPSIPLSPQLTVLLKTTSIVDTPEKPDQQLQPVSLPPIQQIREQLIKNANIRFSGNELTLVKNEIDQVFNSKLNPESVGTLLRYLSLSETEKGDIVAVSSNKHHPSLFRMTTKQPEIGSIQPPSIVEMLKQIPGFSKKESLFRETVESVTHYGTNPETAQLTNKLIVHTQASWLLSKGINEEDLIKTRDELIRQDSVKNSEKIAELDEIKNEMVAIRENRPKNDKLLSIFRHRREQALKTGQVNPVQIPFSRFQEVIQERNLNNPQSLISKINRLFGKIFGEKKQTIQGQIIHINRLKYHRLRLTSFFSNQISRFRFGRAFLVLPKKLSQHGLIELLKTKTSALTQAALKKFAGSAAGKAAGKIIGSAIGKTISSLLIKVGVAITGTASAGIGFIVAAVIGVAKKVISTIFKGINKNAKVVYNYLNSLFFSPGSPPVSFDIKIGNKTTIAIVVGVGVLIAIILPLMTVYGLIGAFVQLKNTVLPNTASIRATPNCVNWRHLSEEVLCKLSKETMPCNNRYVTAFTWYQVNSCFNQIDLSGNKGGVRANFKASIDADFLRGRLQCVGFVTGIEAGFGRTFPQRARAKNYLDLPKPTGYNLTKTGRPTVYPGDIVVWDWLLSGHMAVVVSDNGSTITVAEANGFNGEIRLVDYPFIKLGDKSGNPDGILTH